MTTMKRKPEALLPLTPPMFLEAGERSVDFELLPIGAISVRFSE